MDLRDCRVVLMPDGLFWEYQVQHRLRETWPLAYNGLTALRGRTLTRRGAAKAAAVALGELVKSQMKRKLERETCDSCSIIVRGG